MARPDPEGTVRVMMVWPKELKDSVRAVAGPRGLTEFVTKAVTNLLRETPVPYIPPKDPESILENKQPSEDAPMEPVSVKPAKVAATKPTKKPTTPAASPDEPTQDTPTVVDLPHDTSGRDDLFAKLMAKTGGGDLDSLKSVLKPASEIPKPEPKAAEPVAAGRCPACGEEMIDGECWTCG